MRYGIIFANTGPFVEATAAVDLALGAERAGFESLWTVEHTVVPVGYESTYPYDRSGKMPGNDDAPIPDPLIWLAYLAARTEQIRLATGILILPQRNPVVLAKELATLDALSGGRLELGIGVGWLAEEFAALGIPFEGRGQRADDHIEAMRALWTQEVSSFEGPFTSFEGCISQPKPVRGSVPIHIGGHSEAAARRAGRLGDGFFPGEGNHAKLAHLIEVARNEAVEAGRDPAALEITSGGRGVLGPNAAEEARALDEMGVDRIVVPAFLFYADTQDNLAAYGEQVISKV